MIVLLLAALSAAAVRAMVAWGALDHPGHRSSHAVPTPKGGGIGVVCAFLASIVLLPPGLGALQSAETALVAAAVAMAALGYADDVFTWPFLPKLAGQVAAAAAVLAAGLAPDAIAWGPSETLHLGVAAIPLAFCWLLFVTNAVNFLDGLNGLVGGSTAMFAVFLAAAGSGGFLHAASLGLAAGIAGFLPFNYPRARVFLGDAGSQFLGFLLAGLSLRGMAPGSGVPPLLAPFLLAPLLLDAAFTLARRALAGEKLTEAHRGHLYQLAHRSGLGAPVVAAAFWALSAWSGGCALLPAAGVPVWGAALLAVLPAAAAGAFILSRARLSSAIGRW